MPYSDRTVIARSPLLLLRYAEQQGMDRAEVMRESGLTEERITDPDARLPVSCVRRLWSAIIERSDDEHLGINAGRVVTVREMGLVGYAMYHSADLYAALSNLCRYGRIVSDAVTAGIQEKDDRFILRCNAPPFMITMRHPVESMLSLLITISRELTGKALTPLSVRVPEPRPDSTTAYDDLFGLPVTFNAAVASIAFSRRDMALPTRAPDAELIRYLTELAEAKLAELGDRSGGLVDRVRRTIWASLPDDKPDLSKIAREMGMSPRTLQRRLSEHGTSFSAVLEDFRREMAEELRANQGFAAAEVAFMLGYSESSAYQRAARRWREMSDI